MEHTGTHYDVIYIDRKYHVEPEQMKAEVARAMAQLPPETETMLVAMGFCGGVWDSVRFPVRIVIPKTDDCVSLLLQTDDQLIPNRKEMGHLYVYEQDPHGFSELTRWKGSFDTEPEFLWSSLPECAALRVPGKKPWFAVIGRIPRNKIGAPGSGTAEVINLKAAPEDVKAYKDSGMAFPAYHMNKQHWYTLLLDDTQSDNQVMELIRKSYALVE